MDLLSWVPGLSREKFFDGVTLLALIGAAKFLIEYIRENRRKRMAMYGDLRKEFRTNQNFSDIFEALDEYHYTEGDDKAKVAKKIAAIRLDTRSEFAAFLEDIAMTMKSGALKPRVANYMFGYYTILCWETEPFWVALRDSRNDPYWALLKNFVWWMKLHRKILEAAPWLVVWSLKV